MTYRRRARSSGGGSRRRAGGRQGGADQSRLYARSCADSRTNQSFLCHASAYVQAGAATLLATIQQIDPIEVDLTQSSAERLRLRREMDAGRLQTDRAGAVRVNLTLEDGSRYPHTGT